MPQVQGQAPGQPPTLFEFKINDNVVKVPDNQPQGRKEEPIYVPMVNPLNPLYYQTMNPVPVIKKYNISISNTNGDYVKLHNLFEDVLPQVNGITQKTLTTLKERSTIYQYLRSIFIKHNDGEDIILDGTKSIENVRTELTSLLSHIKMMDMNPYHFSRITNNPYGTLPDNFIMFRSCYPIRYNNTAVSCALDNIGINIRIYQMKVYDILADNISDKIKKVECDLWREIAYYEFIREEILKRNVCPNFIMPYAWYKTFKSGIDFTKLKNLKKYGTINFDLTNQNKDVMMDKVKQSILEAIKSVNLPQKPNQQNSAFNYPLKLNSDKLLIVNLDTASSLFRYEVLLNSDDIKKIDPNFNTNKAIIMLTEAPTQNIFDWGTRSYTLENGPIKKMIQTGYHDITVWQSVIFQLLVAFITLDVNNIVMNEMKLENNVFIKDLHREENIIGYWKYKVFGIDFYVPNYGYLLMIDSKYHDLVDGIKTVKLSNKTDLKYKYKIFADMFSDPTIPPKDFETQQKEVVDKRDRNISNLFSSDFFKSGFSNYGGITPPKEILTMLEEIQRKLLDNKKPLYINPDYDTELIKYKNNYAKLVLETQNHFIHNRVGKFVKDIEKDQLILDNNYLKCGDLIGYRFSGSGREAYTYGIFINKNEDDFNCNIYTITDQFFENQNTKLHVREANVGDVFKIFGSVEQNYKPNQKISEEDILETYNINFTD